MQTNPTQSDIPSFDAAGATHEPDDTSTAPALGQPDLGDYSDDDNTATQEAAGAQDALDLTEPDDELPA